MKRQILESYIFEPQHDRPSKLFPKNAAVLLGTPVASLVMDRRGKPAETGVRAQRLANFLGARVVAYQDLGPKVRIRGIRAARRRLAPRDFPGYTVDCANDLRLKLSEADIQNVVIRSHSGNGPLGTGLCLALPDESEGIKVTHMDLSDPAAIREASLLGFAWRFGRYVLGPRKNIPPEHKTQESHPKNTFGAFLGDAAVRGTSVWLTDVTLKNLETIAVGSKQTAVRIHLPGNTFNGTAQEMRTIAKSLNEMGELYRGEADAPFLADFVEGDFHSSRYDSHGLNAYSIGETVKLAPFTEI